MPGMGGRMSVVIKAKINKLLDRAEDPSETLEYSYQKQMELLQNVKKGIADVVTSKKRLQLQQQKLEQQVVKLDTQARQALSQGREDLARTALERKQFAQGELQSLDQQVAELESQQASLIEKEQKLRGKIDQFRTKKEVIKAQYSAAEASVKISEAASAASARRWPTSGWPCSGRSTRPRTCAHARARWRSSRPPARSMTTSHSAPAARTTSTASCTS